MLQLHFVQKILGNTCEGSICAADSLINAVWSHPRPVNVNLQSSWDDVLCHVQAGELKPLLNQHHLVCFNMSRSGAWLSAVPPSAVRTLLDGDALCVVISHRLGLRMLHPHKCHWGATMDEFALHPLSCRFSAGQHPRHSAIDYVIQPALNAAGFLSQLECLGLDRGDGKWPDGIFVFPFAGGRSLIWDATCCNTWSQTGIILSAVQPESCSKKAEELKVARYSTLNKWVKFQPVVMYASGVLGPSSMKLLEYVGSKITKETIDKRETEHLFMRILLAVMKTNACSVMAARCWLT